MGRAAVLQLVEDLAPGILLEARERFYDEVTRKAGLGETLAVNVTIQTLTAGTAVYALPETATRPLHFLSEKGRLDEVSRAQIAASKGAAWRDHRGAIPEAVIREDDSFRSYRLYPIPSQTSAAWIPVMGEPLGEDLPPGALLVVHTERREDFPAEYDLLLALRIVALELATESEHADPKAAAVAGKLAETVGRLLR